MAIAARLPVEGRPGREIVQAKLNGKPARLLFDTGSWTSVITLAASDRLGLRLVTDGDFQSHANSFQLRGVGGARSAIGVTARTVELGALHAKNFNFIAADFSIGGTDGLLSSDLISQFDVDLDFPEHQIQLFEPVGDCTTPAAFLEGPLYPVKLYEPGENRSPRVVVQIGGKDVIAEIDTGAPTSVLYRRAAERLGIKWKDLAAGPMIQEGGFGPRTVAGARYALDSIAIGDLEFGHVPVEVLDEHGDTDQVEMLLGADFQSKVHLWISYSSKTLIIQYPPKATKKAG
jgi:predicted aspartyl protease